MDRDTLAPTPPPPVLRDPPPPPASQKPVSVSAAPIFAPDLPFGPDALGHDAALRPVAELIAHPGARPPLTVGIFGGPGSGKSAAAGRLTALAGAFATAASRSKSSPFLKRILTMRISAAEISGDVAPAIGAALETALSTSRTGDGIGYSALAMDALRDTIDPHVAARQAMATLDAARDRLDIERKALDDLEARKARLVDSILYETAGSRIDAHARSNRAPIEARLRGFGFEGDPVATYKDLSRDAAEHPGFFGALSMFVRSLWAFKGQGRLIAWAIIMFFLAQGCLVARDNSGAWLNTVRGVGDNAAPIANWLETHLSWFDGLRQVATILIFVLLAINVIRAIRFASPIQRGARLLNADIETRRGQIDSGVSHQTRRVDSLSREVAALSERAAEAETRAATKPVGPAAEASPFGTRDGGAAASARAYLAFVSAATARGDANAPQRIVAIIDDLDDIAPARAVEIIQGATRLLARDGFVIIIAADASRLARAWPGAAEAADGLDRLVQIPVCLPDTALDGERVSDFTRALMTNAPMPAPAPMDEERSTLDDPVKAVEVLLMSSLAPLAARSPRAAKRFVNLYRLARGRTSDTAGLAFMLAVDSGATSAELAAMGAAMDAPAEQPLMMGEDQPRLSLALDAANKSRGKPLTAAEARDAWGIVRDYRMPL